MNNVPSTTMKTTKQKDENGLRNLAMRYVRLEDFFAHGAHGKAKTPQEMLKKLSILLKDLDSYELTCLYCLLFNIFEIHLSRALMEFSDAELDEAIDAAHTQIKKEEEKEGKFKWHPDYTTMRQDTKGSPEYKKIAKHYHFLSLRD